MYLSPEDWRKFFTSLECYLQQFPWVKTILLSATQETQNLNRTRVKFSREVRIGLLRFLTNVADSVQSENSLYFNKLSDASIQAIEGLSDYCEYAVVKKKMTDLVKIIENNTKRYLLISKVISKITMMGNAEHED